MAGEYKVYVRNQTDDGWVNVLKDNQIELTGTGWGAGVNYVDEALAELASQIGGPGYGGEKIQITNDIAATDVNSELASLSTRGGIEIFKNLMIGGNPDGVWGSPSYDSVALEVLSTLEATSTTTGAVQVAGGVGIVGNLHVGGDYVSVGGITTTDDIQGATLNSTGLTTANSLSVTTTVSSALTPTDTDTYDLGEDTLRWNTVYATTLNTANLVTSGDLSGTNITATGTTTTEDLVVGGNVTLDIDSTFSGNIVPATGVQTLGSLASPWNTVYVDTLDVGSAISGTFIGSFTGDLSGNVIGTTVTADSITATTSFQGDIEGNIIGDSTNVTSGWDVVAGVGNLVNDALEVTGGLHVYGNATIDKDLFIGQNVTITGSITAGNLDFANFNSNIIPITTDTYNLGSGTNRFNEIHAVSLAVDSFSATNVSADLIGDVLSQDGNVIVLENGTDGTDATFTGNVTGDLTGDLSAATTNFNDLSGDNVTASAITTTDQLSVTTSVNSDLVPDVNYTEPTARNLGVDGTRWNELWVQDVHALNVMAGSVSGSFLGDLAGDLVGTLTTAQSLTVNDDLVVLGSITADSISFTNVESDLIGNVLSQDGLVIVLENGTDGTDATFAGNVTGDLTGDLVAPVVTVTQTTVSNDWTDGALVVAGGVGIAGDLNVQGDITTLNNFFVQGTFSAAASEYGSLRVTDFTDSSSPGTGALQVTQGGLGVARDIYAGRDIDAGRNLNVAVNTTIGGTLDVTGMAYIRDDLNIVGANINVPDGWVYTDKVESSTTDTNLQFEANGLGVVEVVDSFTVSGVSTFTNATNSDNTEGAADPATGALQVTGGIGVGGNGVFGGEVYAIGGIKNEGNLDFPYGVTIGTGNGLSNPYDDSVVIGKDAYAGSGATAAVIIGVNAFADSHPNNIAIGNYAYAGGWQGSTAPVGNAMAFGADTNAQHRSSVIFGQADATQYENTFHIGGSSISMDFYVSGTSLLEGAVTITDTTQSIDIDSGALIVDGGVGIEKDVYVGGTVNATTGFVGDVTGNLTGDVLGSLVGDTVEADTITANLGFVGDLTKITQVSVTNNTPANALGEGAFYVSGGVVGPLGAGMSVNGNAYIGGNLILPTIGTDITLPSGRTLEDELDARPVENGFVDRAQSLISFDDGTMTFTIEPNTGGGHTEFEFYSGGVGFIKNAADPVTITDTEGLWYFYYVGDVLTASQTFTGDIITTHAFIAAVYWSVAQSAALTLAEERHGNIMSNATHGYLHNTQGTKLAGGGALGNLQTDQAGDNDTHVQLDVANFVTYDEDIRRDIVNGIPQTLVGPAELPVWYQEWDGTLAQNVWKKQTAGTIPLIKTGTGGEDRPAYNQNIGGQYQLTEITDLNYMAMHIVATNDVNEPVVAIVGTNEYPDLNSAYEGGGDEAGNIEFGDIASLSPEWVFLGTVILESQEAYTNTFKARFRADVEGNDYIDLRGSALSPSGGTTADDHAGLTNLQGGTIGSYFHSDQMINIASVPRWAGINIDWQTATDALTLTAGQRFLVPTAVASLLLPAAPVAGQSIHLSDVDGTWGSSPVTLSNNGQNIEGVGDSLMLNVPNSSVELVFTASVGWKII